ncbi:hypothetical protein DOTSEDRAFT_119511 [Dothistroma septosporum NZE10]|uniref:Protein ZIP4 homolog n=1 Tax=Dothistroma septosporum (strain NZE10 / CBS 128990) TaxID=675120 RepID=N1Q1L9_DOTSN|nr:hypothetical protein DOTSEDRAFT_119511 [Dothistroma septosporum NZE10]
MSQAKAARKSAADKLVTAIIGRTLTSSKPSTFTFVLTFNLETATKLQQVLHSRGTVPANLQAEVERHVRQVSGAVINTSLGGRGKTLDSLGTELWNASANITNDEQFESDARCQSIASTRLIALLRLFALFLVNTAQSASARRSRDPGQKIRVFKIALRAAKLCLDKLQLDLAVISLELCSQFVDDKADPQPLLPLPENVHEDVDHESIIKTLASEYHLLRLLHVWRSNRLDMAELFYPKIQLFGSSEADGIIVKAADLFYDIAKSLSDKDRMEHALKWFDRAFAALDASDDDSISTEASDLRLSIGISYCERLLASRKSQRATEIVNKLQATHGLSSRVAVPILLYKVLVDQPDFDSEEASRALLNVVQLTMLSEDSIRMTMRTLRSACQTSPTAAFTAIRALICTRLLPAMNEHETLHTWLEKALMTYVLLATSQPSTSTQALPVDLTALLDTIRNSGYPRLSTKATHAMQTLLWKASLKLSSDSACDWCQMMTHPAFDNAGHVNKGRIGRKLMRLALDNDNIPAAREAFFQMPSAAQNDTQTRYLAFKLGLKSKDEQLAMSSLQIVMKHSNTDPTHLYACALDAQQSDMRPMAVAALQAILDQRPPGMHLPSLLRCTARLIMSESDVQGSSVHPLAQEAVKIFETAVRSLEEVKQLPSQQWRTEVQWWSKNAYNLAVRLCVDADPEHIVRLLDVCATFLNHYPDDAALMQHDRVEEYKSLCAFLATTALVAKARSAEDDPEYKQQCYLHAQKRIDTFKSIQSKLIQPANPQQNQERTFTILNFELECILHLQQWHRLSENLTECLNTTSVERWDTLADLLIILHSHLDTTTRSDHTEQLITLLQRCINETWKRDKNIHKVARWVRFTFTLCLNHSSSSSSTDTSFSFKLLTQAALMTQNGYNGKHDAYPQAEIHYLAATSFNHGIDLWVQGERDEGYKWMEGSLAVAKWASDNGALHAMLSGKLESVRQREKGRG